MAHGRRGRSLTLYTPKVGAPVPGLCPLKGGRWSVTLPSGERIRFTEHDESKAVMRARSLLAGAQPTIDVPLDLSASDKPDIVGKAMDRADYRSLVFTFAFGQPTTAEARYDAHGWWETFTRELLERPAHAAQMTGIPQLATLSHLPQPQPSLTIEKIVTTYQKENASSEKSKREAVKPLQRLCQFAQAKTLADLTTEKLLAFRRQIENDAKLKSPATRKAYYGRIKTVIGFGLDMGLDSLQIRPALDRCKVLWTREPMPPPQPRPISRSDFHQLLKAAGKGPWRAWLLVGLNLCLHIEEVCALRWGHLDLTAGTHAQVREKTRRKRVPRAAVLWDETLAELRPLPRRGNYVFISTHGTRYNKNTRVNDFRELRRSAGLPDTITFDTLRDGAYTAAVRGTGNDRDAKVLAGHSCGLQDAYVLRNPKCAEPACRAVYAAYGPFPLPAGGSTHRTQASARKT